MSIISPCSSSGHAISEISFCMSSVEGLRHWMALELFESFTERTSQRKVQHGNGFLVSRRSSDFHNDPLNAISRDDLCQSNQELASIMNYDQSTMIHTFI